MRTTLGEHIAQNLAEGIRLQKAGDGIVYTVAAWKSAARFLSIDQESS
jgi:hypothetical protein